MTFDQLLHIIKVSGLALDDKIVVKTSTGILPLSTVCTFTMHEGKYALTLSTDEAIHGGAALETVALCPHGMPLAENTCGPCSEGRPNAQPEPDLGFGVAILRSMARAHMRDGASQEEAIAKVAEYGELRSEAIEALRSALNRSAEQ